MEFLAKLFSAKDNESIVGAIFRALSRFMEIFFPANAPAAFKVSLD